MLDFKDDDVLAVLQLRHELFRFCFTFWHFKSLLVDLVRRLWSHTHDDDKADVSDVYNRGNDFYGWFMCNRILYSSGIYEKEDEDIEVAQTRKLHTICNFLQLKEGEQMLDLGCGWGALISFAAKHYGVNPTGITLSKEQKKFAEDRVKELGVQDKVDIQLLNAWDLEKKQ